MRVFRPTLALVCSLTVLGLAVSACGDGKKAEVSGGGSGSGSTNGMGGSADGDGNGTGGAGPGSGGTLLGDLDEDSTDKDTDFAECASSEAKTELDPVYLVFLLDDSGSMGDGKNGDITKLWNPVTSAMKSFFADAASAGIQASLTLFPTNQNLTTGVADPKNYPPACVGDAYSEPVVPMTLLPNLEPFEAAIGAATPPNESGTPTRYALEGAVIQAEAVLAGAPGAHVAIVLVTDGQPASCSNNTIATSAAVAEAVADRIPTYVIGVGSSLSNLNTIAAAGGTESAFIVAVDDPAATQASFSAAINSIRGDVLSCDMPMPPPPQGESLDPDKVNIVMSTAGEQVTLKQNPTCDGGGWRYDDPESPTIVQLCPSTCGTVQALQNVSIDVVFGCATRVVVR